MHLSAMQTLAGTSESVTVFDVIQFNVFCTAVPGFLLISHFLLFQKTDSVIGYWQRILDFVYLYLFWLVAWVMVTKSKPEKSFAGILEFLLRGGGWAYYYFAVLIINSLLCMAIHRLATKHIIIGLSVVSVFSATMFHNLASDHLWMTKITYWWPACFLTLPFCACLMSRNIIRFQQCDRVWLTTSLILLVATLSFATLEWQFSASAAHLEQRPFLPDYLRISLSLGACFALILSLKITYVPRVIKFISKNSLGIFCLHVFVLRGVYQVVEHLVEHELISLVIATSLMIVIGAVATEYLRFLLKQRVI
jgi:fucose 4-O-acetylase-like acetyltransferase